MSKTLLEAYLEDSVILLRLSYTHLVKETPSNLPNYLYLDTVLLFLVILNLRMKTLLISCPYVTTLQDGYYVLAPTFERKVWACNGRYVRYLDPCLCLCDKLLCIVYKPVPGND